MELQRQYPEIRKQGLGLIAVSYDAPDTLKKFSASRGISFPLISDRDSAIIRAFGILNESEKPGARGYGIPHPGTFIVDRRGRVVARFFEAAYQERNTTAAILATLDAATGGVSVKGETAHLSFTASLSDAVAAPGGRLSLTVDVIPAKGIHVYAPGKHDYQVVRVAIDPQPWLRTHAAVYPRPEIYHFRPLDERVEVFMKPFRLRRPEQRIRSDFQVQRDGLAKIADRLVEASALRHNRHLQAFGGVPAV